MGIAGMVLGILAMVFLWIPFVGWIIALIMVAVGLPLSVVGFRKARREGEGAGMSITGMVLNIVAIGIIGLVIVAFGSLLGIGILATS